MHLFQVVGVQLFHFLSLRKPHTYPPSFLVLFQLIKFHKFLASKCFSIHYIFLQTNQHQSLSFLQLVFLHFVSALSNPSLFVKLFLFLSFFLAFGRVSFLRYCYLNLVSTFSLYYVIYSNKFVMINIETLEIKSLIVCNLVFVNDGIFSWFFCFFLINDFYDLNFCKHCKKNFPTAELVIPTGIPTNKAKAEIKM